MVQGTTAVELDKKKYLSDELYRFKMKVLLFSSLEENFDNNYGWRN